MAAALGVSLAGCGGGGGDGGDGDGGDGGGGATVDMTDELAFEPGTVTVSVGETVTWENVGTVGHSVTAYEDQIPDGADYWASGDFDSQADAVDAWTGGFGGRLSQSQSFEHTFEVVGTHHYYCIPHEASGMKGRIVVTEDATPPGE